MTDRQLAEWSAPVTFLPAPLFRADRAAIVIPIAWLTAFFPSLFLGAVANAFFPGAAQPDLPMGTGVAVVLVAVVAPVIETLIMAAILSVLLMFLRPTLAVVASAVAWGIAHSLAAPIWGLVVWWPFLIFSILYVTWRQRSLAAALAMPAIVHGLQNLVPALWLGAAT